MLFPMSRIKIQNPSLSRGPGASVSPDGPGRTASPKAPRPHDRSFLGTGGNRTIVTAHTIRRSLALVVPKSCLQVPPGAIPPRTRAENLPPGATRCHSALGSGRKPASRCHQVPFRQEIGSKNRQTGADLPRNWSKTCQTDVDFARFAVEVLPPLPVGRGRTGATCQADLRGLPLSVASRLRRTSEPERLVDHVDQGLATGKTADIVDQGRQVPGGDDG